MAHRRRSIDMSAERSRWIALAAAYLGVSGEAFIQLAIDHELTAIACRNPDFGQFLDR